MHEADRKLFAIWQEIGTRASKETDVEKLALIIDELRAALKSHEQIMQVAAKKSAGAF